MIVENAAMLGNLQAWRDQMGFGNYDNMALRKAEVRDYVRTCNGRTSFWKSCSLSFAAACPECLSGEADLRPLSTPQTSSNL